MRKVIITGDDFGRSVSMNEAIETAHRRGILNTASLMVGGMAAMDAIERARRLPGLRVGLHLVVVDGASTLPRHIIPTLVDAKGAFSSHLVRAGVRFFFRKKVRRQLESEIRAQFEAFQRTGLVLDHVSSHHHLHLHPTVLEILLRVGRDFELKAVRFPFESLMPRGSGFAKIGFIPELPVRALLFPWIIYMRYKFRREGIRFNNYVIGMHDTGRMHPDLVMRLIRELPPGVTEIYFHPDSSPGNVDLGTLVRPDIADLLTALEIQIIAFGDL